MKAWQRSLLTRQLSLSQANEEVVCSQVGDHQRTPAVVCFLSFCVPFCILAELLRDYTTAVACLVVSTKTQVEARLIFGVAASKLRLYNNTCTLQKQMENHELKIVRHNNSTQRKG
jgi:hypothetical protein